MKANNKAKEVAEAEAEADDEALWMDQGCSSIHLKMSRKLS